MPSNTASATEKVASTVEGEPELTSRCCESVRVEVLAALVIASWNASAVASRKVLSVAVYLSWKPGTAAVVPGSWNSALKKLLPAIWLLAAGSARSAAVRSQRAYSFWASAV